MTSAVAVIILILLLFHPTYGYEAHGVFIIFCFYLCYQSLSHVPLVNHFLLCMAMDKPHKYDLANRDHSMICGYPCLPPVVKALMNSWFISLLPFSGERLIFEKPLYKVFAKRSMEIQPCPLFDYRAI